MIVIEAELALLGEHAMLPVAPQTPPFREYVRAAWSRLEWPGDGCDVAPPVAYWGGRYAAVVCDGIAVIDATDGAHARLQLDIPGAASVAVEAGWLRVGLPTGVLSLPLVALEQLAATPGAVELHLNVVYPRRRSTAREPATVAWLYDNGDAVVNVAGKQIWLDARPYGLGRAMKFTLCDELWPGEYLTIDVPGQPERALRDIETERTMIGHVIPELPPHPLRHRVQPASLRRERVEPLLLRLADDPTDDETRGVLVDVLQEEGVPYARALAEARAAHRAHGWALAPYLAPLDRVFQQFEWRAGLPFAAALLPQLPADDELLALIARDVRLGMLVRIRRDNASIENYVRVLSMPLAIGVREVDSCNPDVLLALIDARRDRLTRLYGVLVAKPQTHRLLADPTFDRVRELDVVATRSNIEALLDSIVADEAGWLARAPRKVAVVTDKTGVDSALPIEEMLRRWRTLPVLAISMNGITLERARLGIDAPAWAYCATTVNSHARGKLERMLPELRIEPQRI